MAKLDAQAIIDYIGNSEKKTPVKVYVRGDLGKLSFPTSIRPFVEKQSGVIFGDWKDVKPFF